MKSEIQKLRNLAKSFKDRKINKVEFNKRRQIWVYVI